MGRSKSSGKSSSSKSTNVISPIGDRQKDYCKLLSDRSDARIIAGLGPAGCGKTLFACHSAISSLASGLVDRVIITRPIVPADEELGFLPGSIQNKMDPWIRPIMDILGDFYSKTEVRRLINEGIVEIAPLAYMRGRTFRRSFIIADEMQNSTPNQMLMILTRIGEDSRLVITGDLMQSDLKGDGINGLKDFHDRWKLKTSSGSALPIIQCVEFDNRDVQRSESVAAILEMYSFTSLAIQNTKESSPAISDHKTESSIDNWYKNRKTGMDDCAMFPKGL